MLMLSSFFPLLFSILALPRKVRRLKVQHCTLNRKLNIRKTQNTISHIGFRRCACKCENKHIYIINLGLDARKPVFGGLRTTDHHAHPRSMISAFVIRVLESTISKLATSKISFF